MCELFGICSRTRCRINDYLKVFYSHSVRHPHGWGLAYLDHDGAVIEKEPKEASKSAYLKERLSVPIEVNAAFAHIRYATIGNVEYKNCHPYTGKDKSGRHWTLMHNGTIFDYPPLNKYVKIQPGNTDSERILLYLIDRINDEEGALGRALDSTERFWLLDSVIVEMSRENKLNLLFHDGENIYVHTNCADSLYFLKKDESTVFATVPLSGEAWRPVPFTRLLAYREGSLVMEGTNHRNEYIESEENLRYLYQMYSNL